MNSPRMEQLGDQQFEREAKQRTIGGPMSTKALVSREDFVESLDAELWCRLPEDLLPKIFARLPFRSLFKIHLLSRAWETNLRSPSFQLEASSEVLSEWESYSPLVCSSHDMRMVAYSRASRQWQKLFSLSYLFAGAHEAPSRWQTKSMAGSLLCLKQLGQPGERGILVTNPLLKSWRVLPPHGSMTPFLPAYEIIHVMTSEAVGLPNYAVISISQDSSIRDPLKNLSVASQGPKKLLLPLPHLRAEIYESTTGAWTVNESGPVMPMDLHNVSSVYLKGVVYFSLASSRYESFHLLAFDVMSGTWTTIPRPQESCSLVQLVKCGATVMLVTLSSLVVPRKYKFGPSSDDSSISDGSIRIYEIEGPDFKVTKVSAGPPECIQGVRIVEGIAGDQDCIYLQAFGRPIVVVFNVKQKRWSTVSVTLDSHNATDDCGTIAMSSRHFGPCFNWTNSSFHPGSNSFVAP